jgi:1-aminocyclopropane-1-carboxylate deaminase
MFTIKYTIIIYIISMEDWLYPEKIFTQTIVASWLEEKNIKLDILRLDVLHPVISGNKWFKLKYYLLQAKHNNYNTVATFGGAFSNHILASACACGKAGLKSIGIIRGEQPLVLSHTLLLAEQYGMNLQFISKLAYRDKKAIEKDFENIYWIPEGGYGNLGAKGANEILSFCKEPENYTHIVCAVGTGTMMAGIIQFVNSVQTVIGISVMKNNYSLHEKVEGLLSNTDKHKSYKIIHDYHFGGYAKHPPELIQFMNDTWQQHQVPTDIVYTAKTFYAIRKMIISNTIPGGSNVLMIHSGGLQGNLSLPLKTFCF